MATEGDNSLFFRKGTRTPLAPSGFVPVVTSIRRKRGKTCTCQWVPGPVSPGGGAASGPWEPPETRNRSGPG